MSTLGIGTYIGAPSTIHDQQVFDAVIASVESGGVNVIDTAINYRYMKAERSIGAALQQLCNSGYSREEFFISSKGGYIPVTLKLTRSTETAQVFMKR